MLYNEWFSVEKEVSNQEDISKGIITASSPDRLGDVVVPLGIDLTNYNKNNIVLYAHGRDARIGTRPIGQTIDLDVTQTKITASWRWDMNDPDAVTIKNKWDADFIKGLSIGFLPIEVEEIKLSEDERKKYGGFFGPFKYVKSSLLEYSVVGIPMHPKALKVKSIEELEYLSNFVPSLKDVLHKTSAYDAFMIKLNALETLITSHFDELSTVLHTLSVKTGGDPVKQYTSIKDLVNDMMILLSVKNPLSHTEKLHTYTALAQVYTQFYISPPEYKEWSIQEVSTYLKEQNFTYDEIINVLDNSGFSAKEILTTVSPHNDVANAVKEKQQLAQSINDLLALL